LQFKNSTKFSHDAFIEHVVIGHTVVNVYSLSELQYFKYATAVTLAFVPSAEIIASIKSPTSEASICC
jgi:hypothetical protein